MRILLASDLHYTLPQLDWVVRVAPFYELVVLAGDHLDISSPVSLDAQSIVILRYLALLQAAGRVAACSGNHDLTGPDEQGEQCALWLREARTAGVPTDGDSLLVGDTLFTICPWWDGPLGSQALQARLVADAARRPARWVWVYHWPPLGSPTCWTGKRSCGDTDLGDIWVFNAGRQIGPVPAHIEIDLAAGSARWRSMMGSETLQLSDPVAPERTVF